MARVIKGPKLNYGEPQTVSQERTAWSASEDGLRGDPASAAVSAGWLREERPELSAAVALAGDQGSADHEGTDTGNGSALAEQLRQEAAVEAELIRQRAEREGFEAGRRAGWEEGQRLAQQMVAEAQEMLEQARAEREKILAELEGEIIGLALSIARKILRHEVSLDQEIVLRLAREVLGRLREEETVSLRVNPVDVGTLEAGREQLAMAAPWVKQLELAEDPSVEPGGLVVETVHGRYDGRLEAQLRRVEEALRSGDGGLKMEAF